MTAPPGRTVNDRSTSLIPAPKPVQSGFYISEMDKQLMKRTIVALSCTLLPLATMADCAGYNCSNVKIKRLVVYLNGDVNVSTDGNESYLTCETDTYGYLRLPSSSPNFDAAYSMLLSAKMADIPVARIRTTESGQCEIIYLFQE